MSLEKLVGGMTTGGITAIALRAYYGSTALAAATLGLAYPLAVIGATIIGAYLGNYAKQW